MTFEDSTNALYIKAATGAQYYRLTYDPTNLTSTITHTLLMDQSANNGLKFYSANGVNMIATVCTSTGTTSNGIVHYAKVLQLNLANSNSVVAFSAPLPPPYLANGNSLGLVDFRNGYAAFSEPNNGVSLYQLGFNTNSPPSVTINGGGTLVEGFTNTITSSAGGSVPLRYQWYFNTNTLIANATNANYSLAPVTSAGAGTYNVVVTNAFGAATSSVVTVSTVPNASSKVAGIQWKIAPLSRNYVTLNDTERGLAYDPITSNLVFVARTPTNGIHLLSSSTGADIGQLDYSVIAGLGSAAPGTFTVSMCGVADDGLVYVANLTTDSVGTPFVIYQWSSATDGAAIVGQAYTGDGGLSAFTGNAKRLGDTMSVRGAGTNTQILCSAREGTNVVIFTTTDGATFSPNVINITNIPDSASGLSIVWGAGNTFWTKSAFNLRQVSYDLPSLIGTVINSYPLPGTETVVGVDSLQNYAAIIGTAETPHNLAFYDLSTPGGPTTTSGVIDREFFPSSNVNGNRVGSVAVDAANSRLFAIDTDNGIIEVNYSPRLSINRTLQGAVLSWSGLGTLQSASPVDGVFADVTSTSPYTNTAAAQMYFRLKR